MGRIKYNSIVVYKIYVETIAPLHIGGYLGGKDEILIHSTTGMPFIQASSLAGMLRSISLEVNNEKSVTDNLFGIDAFVEDQNTNEVKSRVSVSDGIFEKDSVVFERRPGVAINRKTGTVRTEKGSGQKYDITYISSEAKFSFEVHLYMKNEEERIELEKVFGGIKGDSACIGAKKSSGSGKFKITRINRAVFDMTNEYSRQNWIRYTGKDDQIDFSNITDEIKEVDANDLYNITVKAKTEGALQIKGLNIEDYREGAPDNENMKNGRKKYIIPGTSIRGAIRSQMEKIETYIGKKDIVNNSFGFNSQNHADSRSGNLVFNDSIFNDTEKISNNPIRNRVHIDKFTGGAISQGLFSERNANGEIEFRIQIKNKNNPDSTLGLLLYALRDLATKTYNIGNGYATGKGYLDIDSIIIRKSDGKNAKICFSDGKGNINDESEIIKNSIVALRSEE